MLCQLYLSKLDENFQKKKKVSLGVALESKQMLRQVVMNSRREYHFDTLTQGRLWPYPTKHHHSPQTSPGRATCLTGGHTICE